jgi:hypothetical protein
MGVTWETLNAASERLCQQKIYPILRRHDLDLRQSAGKAQYLIVVRMGAMLTSPWPARLRDHLAVCSGPICGMPDF